MTKNKFGLGEAVTLLAVSSLARVFTNSPSDLVAYVGPAAWMSPIVGFAIVMVQVYLLWILLKPHKDKNLIEITEDVMGPYVGVVFNLAIVAVLVCVNFLYVRIFSEAMLIATLPQTPVSVVGAAFVICAIWGSYLGLEALARSVKLVYPLIFGGILILMLSLIPEYKINNLYPIFGNGVDHILLSGGLGSSVVAEGLLAAILIKSLASRKLFPKATTRAMIIGFATLFIMELVLLLSIHWRTVSEFVLPFYSLSRSIYLGRFFQRVESIFVIIWTFIALVKIALLLYASVVALAGTLKIKNYRPLIWPVAIITFMLSLLPPDFSATVQYNTSYLRRFFWFFALGLPLIVLVVDRLKRRRKTP